MLAACAARVQLSGTDLAQPPPTRFPKTDERRRTPGAEPPRPAPESIRFSFVLRHAQPGGVRRAYLVVQVAIVGVERRRAVVSVLSIVRGPGLRGVLLAGVAIELFARIEMRAALAALEILVVLGHVRLLAVGAGAHASLDGASPRHFGRGSHAVCRPNELASAVGAEASGNSGERRAYL